MGGVGGVGRALLTRTNRRHVLFHQLDDILPGNVLQHLNNISHRGLGISRELLLQHKGSGGLSGAAERLDLSHALLQELLGKHLPPAGPLPGPVQVLAEDVPRGRSHVLEELV